MATATITDEKRRRIIEMTNEGASLECIRTTLKTSRVTIRKVVPGYQGMSQVEGAKLGAAARLASLKLNSMLEARGINHYA